MSRLARTSLAATFVAVTLAAGSAAGAQADESATDESATDKPASDKPASDGWAYEEWGPEETWYYEGEPVPRWEFALGVGYARVNFEGDAPLVDDRDTLHLEPVLTVAPLDQLRQLRLGAGLGWSMALDDTKGAFISHDGELVAVASADTTFMLFEPDLRLSWRQPLDRDGNSFVEFGGAAGAAIGWLDVGDEDDEVTDPDEVTFSETDTSFQWRVFLRAGMRVDNGFAGIEASYMRAGDLTFADDVSGEAEEFYIGIFGALQF